MGTDTGTGMGMVEEAVVPAWHRRRGGIVRRVVTTAGVLRVVSAATTATDPLVVSRAATVTGPDRCPSRRRHGRRAHQTGGDDGCHGTPGHPTLLAVVAPSLDVCVRGEKITKYVTVATRICHAWRLAVLVLYHGQPLVATLPACKALRAKRRTALCTKPRARTRPIGTASTAAAAWNRWVAATARAECCPGADG